ncbi:Uncharacterised protein [Salmonella enterica subsp. arizonae]|uniref:Uncharacterized protein n=1 Tax=Salmonella enterica subsp. arizonae TaxID=59203 RepID=A0A379TH28_SALER|nr:Uncharacterised protein [Salmonella enterica subsp. arizonae]
MPRIYPLEGLNEIYPLEGIKHIGQSMIPAKLTVSGFEDLLTVPAYVLFSGPQRCVMRKMQLLTVPLPEQVVHHRATADAAGDADS